MKQIRLTKILAASLLCAASLCVALAQTSTTTTTTDPVTGTTTTQQTTTSSAGNIVTYTPDSDSFMFRTTSAAAPVRYYYTKDTTVVDPAGRVVSFSAIRPDTLLGRLRFRAVGRGSGAAVEAISFVVFVLSSGKLRGIHSYRSRDEALDAARRIQ